MASTAAGRPPAITEVELHGIEPIPDEDRTASPLDLFRLEFGGANTFATVVLGAFPILVFAEDVGISRLASVDISLAVAIGLAGALYVVLSASPETGNAEVPVAGSSG